MKAMNEVELHIGSATEEEKIEWNRLQKNMIEEYNALRDRSQDVSFYADQLHNYNQGGLFSSISKTSWWQ